METAGVCQTRIRVVFTGPRRQKEPGEKHGFTLPVLFSPTRYVTSGSAVLDGRRVFADGMNPCISLPRFRDPQQFNPMVQRWLAAKGYPWQFHADELATIAQGFGRWPALAGLDTCEIWILPKACTFCLLKACFQDTAGHVHKNDLMVSWHLNQVEDMVPLHRS